MLDQVVESEHAFELARDAVPEFDNFLFTRRDVTRERLDEMSLDDLAALFEAWLTDECRNSMVITNRNQRAIVRLLLDEMRAAR